MTEIPMPPPSYVQTIEAVAACGVPRSSVRIAYEDELQSDVITISDLGGGDEARLSCLRQAVHPFYHVEIGAAAQRDAYLAFAGREHQRRARLEAVAWLKARQMLGRVPSYDPVKGLEAFARSLETACSIPAGSALEPVAPSGLTVRRSFTAKLMATRAYEQFTCLLQMVAASNADDHEIGLFFTGNEASSEDRR